MLDAAKSYHLKARAVKGENSAIVPSLPTPFIAHLNVERENGIKLNHYVVVSHISKKHITILDPDPMHRKEKLSYQQFFEWWT